ncbi:MAG: YjbQ family protein [Ignisphaera sp.]|uniref:YjbQ family protein n=1 Tax=Ignisphaera aggregans TaxID=334771 RepID=A0A7J3JR32_9CREN
MKVFSKMIDVQTFGPMELFPLRKTIEGIVAESGIRFGSMLISVEGATPAIVILEKGFEKRLIQLLETLVPFTIWRHGNAYAHLISTFISTSIALPIENGNILLDEGYEIFLLETRAVYNHKRKLAIHIHGE